MGMAFLIPVWRAVRLLLIFFLIFLKPPPIQLINWIAVCRERFHMREKTGCRTGKKFHEAVTTCVENAPAYAK